MIQLRKGRERGYADHGWLQSHHSFSFADYHDPAHMGISTLRVLNEDRVAPGAGFPTHAHRDMEILSYVLEGALEHKDSLGHGSVIPAGDVQRMSAGSGIRHSEYNASASEPVHFLQIWILPRRRGLAPGYEQRRIPAVEKRGRWRLVASPEPGKDALHLQQDTAVYATVLAPGETLEAVLDPRRTAWLQVARGAVRANGRTLEAGDGARLDGEDTLSLEALVQAEVLRFDLPGAAP